MDHSNTVSIYRARLCRTALVVGIAASALLAASTGSASATASDPATSDEQRPAYCAEADPGQLPHTADAIAGWFGRCYEPPSRGPNTADAMEGWGQTQVSADTSSTVTNAVDEGTALARPRPSECPAPPDPDYVGVPWAAYTDECPDWWKQGRVL